MVLLTRDLLPILMLGVVMPALDQFSDVAFALRLMAGPANDTILFSGIPPSRPLTEKSPNPIN